jgi:predicted  nucleic acid-binding Zn-ribbon protein
LYRYVTAQELARLKSVMEKRDAHIETLEKSLVQLSIEWYSMGEENKQFAAAHANIQEQRKNAILHRLKNMVVSKAFNKWRHEVDAIVQMKMEETLDSAEEAIQHLQEELQVTKKHEKQLEKYVEDKRGKFLKSMMNAPLSRAFRTWAANIGHSKVGLVQLLNAADPQL